MKQIVWVIFLLLTVRISADTVELTASEFNSTYSAENPLILSEQVIILLDEDIVIDVEQPLFVLPVHLETATLQFVSENAIPSAVQILSQALFTIENRSGGNCVVEFRGNAQ